MTGQSPGLAGASGPVSRHIAFQQGGIFVHGDASLGGRIWTASLEAPGLVAGDPAVALGIETYFIEYGDEPVFTSFTWSENIVIGPEPND